MPSVTPQTPLPPSSSDSYTIPGEPPRPAATDNSDTAVPPLEPPAPLSARVRSRGARLQWWLERGRELPSWMSSMVLHLAITIAFASLAIKTGPRPNAVLVLELSASVADTQDDESSAIEFVPLEFSPLPEPQEESQDDSSTTFVNIAELPPLHEEPLPSEEGLPEPEDSQLQEDLQPEEDSMEWLADTEALPGADSDFQQRAKAATDPTVDEPLPIGLGTPGEADPGATPVRHASVEHDDIVERFIQYDIGNLTGAAGDRAKRQFDRLGPEAIPALVRGLNQSARIRASCPVVVISSKLQQTLAQTDDQATIDYVLKNLGRGVPSSAPHFRRVQALRDQIEASTVGEQFYVDLAKSRQTGSGPRSEWVGRVKRLYNADAAEIADALQQPKEVAAACAALAIRQRPDFTPEERLHLAQRLLDQWKRRYQTTANRTRIHAALTTLAVGSGVSGAVPGFRRSEQDNLLRYWETRWLGRNGTNPEVASAKLVQMAKFANAQGAQQLLAQAVEQFPNTQNAKVARHLLTPNSRLALAMNLEKQGRWTEAVLLYNELQTDFPNSPHAATARRRIVLAQFKELEQASSE